jgi:polysaccharide biosynthesis/export protein
MAHSRCRRGLAVFLCAQPVLWMSGPAYAQSLPQGAFEPRTFGPGAGAGAGASAGGASDFNPPGPVVPADPEVMRGDRGVRSVTNALAPVTPLAPVIDEPVDPDLYVCGPGDVLELNFWGVQNFKLRLTIDVEGRAFVPKVGYFSLLGKSLTEARRLMRQSVARFFPRLNFEVALAEPRTFLVQVVDAVERAGSYPAKPIERVSTVIGRAGGFARNASKRRVEIRRRDGKVLVADLLQYTFTGDVKFNPLVMDGDVVRVPFEELAAGVAGAVNRPGRYELVKTRDLAELLELAGGLSPSLTQLLPVTVTRRGSIDRDDLLLFEFSGGKPPAVALQPEDFVRVASVSELQQSVLIVGAVAGGAPLAGASTETSSSGTSASRSVTPDEATATRRLPYLKGDTVRTLLDRVGGVGPLADLQGSYILRGGQTIPVDLYALVVLRDFKADRAVELGDTLAIPFKRRNVLVEGAVFAPGSYPYNPTFGIGQYLSLAGGRSRNAQAIESVKLVTPRGETQDYKPDLKVEPGSSLVVPERNFSRSEVVQIILGAAGIVLSGVAIVLAARK